MTRAALIAGLGAGTLGMCVAGLIAATPQRAGATSHVTCNGLVASIIGTDGPDRIEGTPGRDIIVGLAGKDVILGREGNDVICGGPGNDVIKGGSGRDHLEGNEGNDKLVGGIGKDTMLGGLAKDRLFGGGGGDILIGGGKADLLNGQNGIDECDLDIADRFLACETGDVVGINGVGEGIYPITIPPDFVHYKIGAGGGPQLQNLNPVYVLSYTTRRTGDGTTTLTFLDADGVILNQISSLNETYEGISAVWGRPAAIAVGAGGSPVSFDIVALPQHLLPRFGPLVEGGQSVVYRPDFPTDGTLDFEFTIGDDVSGSVAVFFYDADGNLTSPVFISALREGIPRQYAMAVQTPIRMIEVFAQGSWSLRLTNTTG